MSEFKISPKDWNIDGKLYKPGDRLILTGGTRAEIQFVGLKGTKEAPIVITASEKILIKRAGVGGRVMHFFACEHIHLTGTDKKLIEITGGGHGVTFHDRPNHIEISHLHIHHCGYSGIDITSYPTCDPATWRGAYTMEDIIVRDNLITDMADGEPIYIGPSHYQDSFPLPANCPNKAKTALEHDVKNVQVINNMIKNCGADGIQVGGATGGGSITGNTVENFGTKKVWGQSSGIQANPGSSLLIANNVINGGTSFGIILQGRSSTITRNNLVRNTIGGIMVVAREASDKGEFKVYNNTFLDIADVGVQYYAPVEFDKNVLHIKSGVLYKKDGGLGVLEKIVNIERIGNAADLGLDASFVPKDGSLIPIGIGYKDRPAPPKPVITKETATVELITTDGIQEWYLTTPSGKRKKIE